MTTKTPDPCPADPFAAAMTAGAEPGSLALLVGYRDALQDIVDYDLVDVTGSRADLTEAEALDAVRRIALDALATGDVAMAHPPIASYVLGQAVTFHVDRGDRWIPGVVTRIEGGLHPNDESALNAYGSAWHAISVSRTLGLPDGGWESAGAYRFEDFDADYVSPVTASAPSGPPPSGPRRSRT